VRMAEVILHQLISSVHEFKDGSLSSEDVENRCCHVVQYKHVLISLCNAVQE